MNQNLLKELLKQKQQHKAYVELEAERKKETIYSKNKRLQEIEDKLNFSALSTIKNILASGSSESVLDLKANIENLKKEKEKILKDIGVNSDDIEPKYECTLCKDTGYISSGLESSLCNCIKQKLFDLEYNKSNIGNLEKENFETFNIDLYSNEVNVQKYKSNISPKENIDNINKIAKQFILNFDNPEEKNLLFTGNTGLGKTFLSNAIAKELLSKGKTVLYQTSSVMLDTIIDFRFGKENVSDCRKPESKAKVQISLSFFYSKNAPGWERFCVDISVLISIP